MKILLHRKTNAPFLSGDSFASLADYYAYGKNGTKCINRRKLKAAKVIFVNGHNLARLLSENFNDIHANVIICGNSDENFDHQVNFPKSIKLWLCQNNSIPNSEVKITIPIGLENMRLARAGLPRNYVLENSNSVTNKVLMPPMWPTNPNRYQAVYEALQHKDIFDVYREYIPSEQYVELFGKYKFIFCCEGNGYENHRVWESLYRNSYPIMLDTPWAQTLMDLNLPILLVSKLSHINKELLNAHLIKWKKFDPKNCPSLWIPYWKNLVSAVTSAEERTS